MDGNLPSQHTTFLAAFASGVSSPVSDGVPEVAELAPAAGDVSIQLVRRLRGTGTALTFALHGSENPI